MPSFIDQFADCIARERSRLDLQFDESATGVNELAVRTAIGPAWYPLTLPSAMKPRSTFATDGSEAIRHLNNGWSIIVCQALCVGPGIEAPSVNVRFIRSRIPEVVLNRYVALLMRLLEIRAALDRVDEASGGIICLDGSLYASLPHLLYPLPISEEADLPLAVLESYLDLIDACLRRGILLLNISKTSTASFLVDMLLQSENIDASDSEDLPLGMHLALPSDAEALHRWTQDAGMSRPVVLGSYGFGHRQGQLLSAPESLAEAFSGAEHYSSRQRLVLLERLATLPATVSTYVRPEPHQDVLRLDLLARDIGLIDRICDVERRWGDDARMNEAIARVVGAYGGPSVYHAALYVADQQVRLHRDVMDKVYLSIVRSQFGVHLQYDRSRRRFL